MTNRVVLIIPGFLDSPKEKIYQQIADFYKLKGFEVIILDMPWKRNVMSDYINFFLNVYSEYKNKEVHTLGFSFGAMASFIASSKVNIKSQILCSVSPYFNEDMKLIKKSWAESVGKKRMSDFTNFSRTKIAKTIETRTIMLIGAKERSIMLKVSQAIYNDLKTQKRLTIIKGVGHNVSAEKYYKEIEKQIDLNY